MDPTLPARRAVADIVYAYRCLLGDGGAPLSLRAFAAELNYLLAELDDSISHQTIKNWEDRVHLPRVYFMMQVRLMAPNDWRRDFAQDILAALRPKMYAPVSEIGRAAMKRSTEETGPYKPRYDNRWAQW